MDGICYTIDVANPIGSRIIRLQYQAHDVKPEDTFMIALNSYRAYGGGGYDMLKEAKKLRSVPIDMTEIIADYIRLNDPLHFEFQPHVTVIAH